MEKIATSIHGVTNIMSEITAALVEQTAAAAESLEEQARSLVVAMCSFKVAGSLHHSDVSFHRPPANKKTASTSTTVVKDLPIRPKTQLQPADNDELEEF